MDGRVWRAGSVCLAPGLVPETRMGGRFRWACSIRLPGAEGLLGWPFSLGGLRSDYSAFGCLALLGATRGGSFGIFGYTGGHGASINPLAMSRSDISNNGSID
jgi:hypothetical protein